MKPPNEQQRQTLPDAAVPPCAPAEDVEPGDRRRGRSVSALAFGAIKAQHAAERSIVQTIADVLTDLASSSAFLLLHVAWFAIWIGWNMGVFGLMPFDPFPFGLLTMVVSLEAIFLSIFVLMSQKRESAIAELREEMTLQVNLRIEQEVTKTLQLVSGLYTRLGHVVGHDEELGAMLQPLDISRLERDLLKQIARQGPSLRDAFRNRWRPGDGAKVKSDE